MNVNVYLPDDLGTQAKEAELPFSQLLRDAVVAELKRRTRMNDTKMHAREHILDLEDTEGPWKGRLTATLVAEDGPLSVFVRDDEAILYDADKRRYENFFSPEDELQEILTIGDYRAVMYALGIDPVVDI